MSNILIVSGHDCPIHEKNGLAHERLGKQSTALVRLCQQLGGTIRWGKTGDLEEGQFGWADPSSFRNLETLKAENARHRFLLVYEAPELVFASAYRAYGGDLSAASAALEDWAHTNRVIFEFFQKNREICALVKMSAVWERPSDFNDICRSLLLAEMPPSSVEKVDDDPVMAALVPQLIGEFPVFQELYSNLQLAASIPGEDINQWRDSGTRAQYLAGVAAGYLCTGNVPAGRVNELEDELELSTLQLHQLQEELESYYLKHEKSRVIATGSPAITSRSVDFAAASEVSVVGSYSESGYQDIQLHLRDLALADGRRFESFNCKVASKAGMPALEIRKTGVEGEEALTNWPKDMQDDHGPYLLLLPASDEANREQQRKLIAGLNTTDRALVFGVTNVLRDHFVAGTIQGLNDFLPEEVRMWRTTAIKLAEQTEEINTFLSLDEVDLREEMETESYNHLWLVCHNLQFGKRQFPEYGFKLAAMAEGQNWKLHLEFRELENNRTPLEAWPPRAADEYGHKLLASVEVAAKLTRVSLSDEVTAVDRGMVAAIVEHLPILVKTLADTGCKSKMGWDFWLGMTTNLKNRPVVFGGDGKSLVRRTIAHFRR